MLAGQWAVLLGYALLPMVLYALVRLMERKDTRSGIVLAGALVLMGSVSIHFLYLSTILSIAWISAHMVRECVRGSWESFYSIVRTTVLTACIVGTISMYWIIPALMRETPLESRFDTTHLSSFSASENHLVPTILNVLVLGGFWAEGMSWRYSFVWPQDTVSFWIATLTLLTLVLYGMKHLLQKKETRFVGTLILGIGITSYILALGVWGGVFSNFNAWVYMHIPGWNGLRDSHKVAGVLALVYTLCAGVAVSCLKEHVRIMYWRILLPALFLVPVCIGTYIFWGFHGQLTPVWYPNTWYEARNTLAQSPQEHKVLTLPWRGYYSVQFANQRIVSNLTPSFFGTERTLSGKSVEVGDVYDQEVNNEYRTLDTFLRSAPAHSEEETQAIFEQYGIQYLLVSNNTASEHTWLLPISPDNAYMPNDKELLEALLRTPHTRLIDGEITLYEFKY